MKPVVIAFLIAVVFGCQASAQDGVNIALSGVGVGATWAEAMQYSRQDDPNIGTVFFSWAQGMMSGLNIGKINFGEQSVNLKSNTTEAQMAFINNYCERYPLKRYVEAVMALYKEMGGIP